MMNDPCWDANKRTSAFQTFWPSSTIPPHPAPLLPHPTPTHQLCAIQAASLLCSLRLCSTLPLMEPAIVQNCQPLPPSRSRVCMLRRARLLRTTCERTDTYLCIWQSPEMTKSQNKTKTQVQKVFYYGIGTVSLWQVQSSSRQYWRHLLERKPAPSLKAPKTQTGTDTRFSISCFRFSHSCSHTRAAVHVRGGARSSVHAVICYGHVYLQRR